MSLALRRVLAGVLLALGSLGLCCGLFAGLLFPWLFNTDVALVQGLPSLSYVAFEDGAPGRKVLIEGRLSARNRVSPEGFVLYTRSVAVHEPDGDRSWQELEQVHPSLLVELPDGLVRVVGDYRTNGSMEREERGDRLVEGLRVGAEVIVVGRTVQGQEGLELDAELLGVGTRAEFIAATQMAARFFGIFGWTFVALGVLMLLGGGWLLWRLLRP
jgi:hypothetical protein